MMTEIMQVFVLDFEVYCKTTRGNDVKIVFQNHPKKDDDRNNAGFCFGFWGLLQKREEIWFEFCSPNSQKKTIILEIMHIFVLDFEVYCKNARKYDLNLFFQIHNKNDYFRNNAYFSFGFWGLLQKREEIWFESCSPNSSKKWLPY